MACFTLVSIDQDDTISERARKKLGIEVDSRGQVSVDDARRIRIEAGVMKTMIATQRLHPGAVIRRVGNKLQISVRV